MEYGFEYCVTTGSGSLMKDIYYYDCYNELLDILCDYDSIEEVKNTVSLHNKYNNDDLRVWELSV